ncbi:MAG: CPBP family intramembrane metalloprotease [Minwuia sp.]|nr:CPBP family intramembrane metalloprotease [Minwuia sp.]
MSNISIHSIGRGPAIILMLAAYAAGTFLIALADEIISDFGVHPIFSDYFVHALNITILVLAYVKFGQTIRQIIERDIADIKSNSAIPFFAFVVFITAMAFHILIFGQFLEEEGNVDLNIQYSDNFVMLFDLTIGLALIALSEEWTFRKLSYDFFNSITKNRYVYCIFSIFIFSSVHIPSGPAIFVQAFLIAIPFTLFYAAYRNLAAVILCHYLVNLLIYSHATDRFLEYIAS